MLTHYSVRGAFAIYISLSVIGGICCLLLPIETKGKGLEAINEEVKRLNPAYREGEDEEEGEKLIQNKIDSLAAVPCYTKVTTEQHDGT